MYLTNRVHVLEDKRWHLSSHLFSWEFWLIHHLNPSSWNMTAGALVTSRLCVITGCQPVFVFGPVPSFLRRIIFLIKSCIYSSHTVSCRDKEMSVLIDRCLLNTWNDRNAYLLGNSHLLSSSRLRVKGRNTVHVCHQR